MTDQEVIEMLRSDTPLNRARQEFSHASGRIDQAGRQRHGLSPIEMRRMEFDAVRKIASALGVDERKTVQDVFVRVCRDSGFKLNAVRAAAVTATALKCHPLEIWLAMPSLWVMDAIACGDHPACRPAPPAPPTEGEG